MVRTVIEGVNAGAVTVGAPAITSIAANTSIVVRFRVTIN
jgi:hypothetical protein